MSSGNTKLHPQRLLLSLGVVCGVLGVVSSDTVSSQTTPLKIIVLKVNDDNSTSFKQLSWDQQGAAPAVKRRCSVKAGAKFFILSINDNEGSEITFNDNNGPENLRDYWNVKFDNPLPCAEQDKPNDTWYVYKKHAQYYPIILRR